MKLSSLQAALDTHPDAAVDFQLSDQSIIPAHFHITEVGRVRKDFIDCGGTVRWQERCVLQVWVAEDREHRVTAAKLAKILKAGRPILRGDDLEVEVEYDVGVITQMPLEAIDASDARIVVQLGGKHTACLAADRCGVADSSCNAPGCCAPPEEGPVALGVRR